MGLSKVQIGRRIDRKRAKRESHFFDKSRSTDIIGRHNGTSIFIHGVSEVLIFARKREFSTSFLFSVHPFFWSSKGEWKKWKHEVKIYYERYAFRIFRRLAKCSLFQILAGGGFALSEFTHASPWPTKQKMLRNVLLTRQLINASASSASPALNEAFARSVTGTKSQTKRF